MAGLLRRISISIDTSIFTDPNSQVGVLLLTIGVVMTGHFFDGA